MGLRDVALKRDEERPLDEKLYGQSVLVSRHSEELAAVSPMNYSSSRWTPVFQSRLWFIIGRPWSFIKVDLGHSVGEPSASVSKGRT